MWPRPSTRTALTGPASLVASTSVPGGFSGGPIGGRVGPLPPGSPAPWLASPVFAVLLALRPGLDRIRARVDDHDSRIDQLETCTSGLEETRQGERDHLLRMERVLEVLWAKSEDLEARSRHNNL
ncbi:hypothetical protein NDU88_001959 [Pleurodeles waltl]|uniref:Uncharacterized protein n=1 Tax=Pleurodeles waltl TaxID=8319 RepID=A0AAV7UXE2_PLEWA|nr:hypothetical protein NDU88_001959 [Pleurodeles waltl]